MSDLTKTSLNMLRYFKDFFSNEVSMLDTTKMQCAIYGDDEEHEAILCDNGELSTTFEITGSSAPLTIDNISNNAEYVADQLSGFFKKKDQQLIATYYNNPNDDEYVRRAQAHYDRCCDAVGLSVKDIHTEDLQKVAELSTTSRFFLTVESGKDSIAQEVYARYEKAKAPVIDDYFKQLGLKSNYSSKHLIKQYGQNPLHFNGGIYHHHQNVVNNVLDTLNAARIGYEVMPAKLTMRFLHRIFSQGSPLNWQPVTTPQTDEELERDYLRMMRIEESSPAANKEDLSNRLLPPLVTQIVGDDAEIHKDGIVSLNGQFFKPMYIEVPQSKLELFASFIKTARDIPFVMSWYLEANDRGIRSAIMRGTFIGMAGFLPGSGAQSCRDIKRAADILKSYQSEGVTPMAMYRLLVLTWADSYEDCRTQSNTLRTKIESWGSEQIVKAEKGNPVQLMLETMPSMAKPTISRAMPCLVSQALVQMPFDKVSSPWKGGSLNFVSAVDNTIFPVDIGERQQNFPRSLMTGPTGVGKTYLKNSLLFNSLFKKPYHKLPVLAMCTIGYDGELFANLVRSGLPEDQQHYVIHDQPKLTADYAVNIFDTHYGAREANTSQIQSIVGFLEQCFAEPDQARLPQDFNSVITQVVKFSYQYFSDSGDNAKEFTTGADKEIDDYFAQSDIDKIELRKWSWWQAFDYFHDQGNTRLAYRCQLQAMPSIADLMHVLSENQSVFDDAKKTLLHGTPIFNHFKNRILDLQNSYPNLTGITRYNIESARIVVFDLERVCPKGSQPHEPETGNDRQSAIMYQLYFMFLTKKFFIPQSKADFLGDTKVPDKYHAYHFKIIEAEKGIPKIFDVDEFHRASKAHSFKREIDRIIREMRKYGAEFSGASQRITDWQPAMIDQMGAVFIMQISNSGDEYANLQKCLGFTANDFALAEKHLRGFHSEKGQPFLLLLNNIEGGAKRALVPLYYKSGVRKVWALTTDKDNNDFKSMLQDRLIEAGVKNPVMLAREVLSEQFPSGSIKSKVASQQHIYPNKDIQTIKTELLNQCLKIVLEEKINA